MASIFFKYYAAVEQASDAAVKREYGVTKTNVLKVLEKLFIEDLRSGSGPDLPKTAVKGKRGPKPGARRGRKPGKLAAKKAKVPGRRGRKPGTRLIKSSSPGIEVS